MNDVALLPDPGTRQPLLATVDSGVLRVWDWEASYVLAALCERWNPELQIETPDEVPQPLSRSRICAN